MSNLTIKQEKFCLEYIKDGNASRAYREAYNTENMKPESINRKAKELFDNVKVAARIDEIRKETSSKAILSIEERKELLSMIAKNIAYDKEGNANYGDARGAIDLLNKMDGVYIQKNQTELSGELGVKFNINLQ